MRHIAIHVIDHSQQRYDTVGDWQYEGETLKILVSDTGDWRMNMLIALHEADEAVLCKERGISEEAVTAFDKAHLGADDPGMLPDAPYRRQHFFATCMEMLRAAELGVDWNEYEDRINAL